MIGGSKFVNLGADLEGLLDTLFDGQKSNNGGNTLWDILPLPGILSHMNILDGGHEGLVSNHDALKELNEVELSNVSTIEETLNNLSYVMSLVDGHLLGDELVLLGVNLLEELGNELTSLLVVSRLIGSHTGVPGLAVFLGEVVQVSNEVGRSELWVLGVLESSLTDGETLLELLVSSEGGNGTTKGIRQGLLFVSFILLVGLGK